MIQHDEERRQGAETKSIYDRREEKVFGEERSGPLPFKRRVVLLSVAAGILTAAKAPCRLNTDQPDTANAGASLALVDSRRAVKAEQTCQCGHSSPTDFVGTVVIRIRRHRNTCAMIVPREEGAKINAHSAGVPAGAAWPGIIIFAF
ncbi:hypothetical protein F518_03451 [Serratia marcescens VGH107]|nr:hypothetical protein F518_03451 [Serratia marcescens VGH107]